MTLSRPRLIVSALRGGAGKTTLALGLAAAWRRQGARVFPFKKGPDYIDAGWLSRAAGAPARNLDPYMMDWSAVADIFTAHTSPDGVAVIEGNRGLFDGLDRRGATSTAELAKRLDAPVLLVLDVTKSTRTTAALVLGCRQYDPAVKLAGVVLNHVAGARHERLIRECLEDIGVRVFGALPRLSPRQGDMPERHLGLVPHQEHPEVEGAIARLRETVERYLDLPALLAAAQAAPPMEVLAPKPSPTPAEGRVTIGVIQDEAFQFYYPENLEALRRDGARLAIISALRDPGLPAEVDALYIGGGFPETQAAALAGNISFRESVRSASAAGLPIYAECGGLMYLSRQLTYQGRTFPMCGALPLDVSVHARPQGHGYTRILVDRDNPFYPPGTILKGHEFHYSRVDNLDGGEAAMTFAVQRGVGIAGGRDGYLSGNTLATYTHVHAAGFPAWSAALVGLAGARARTHR